LAFTLSAVLGLAVPAGAQNTGATGSGGKVPPAAPGNEAGNGGAAAAPGANATAGAPNGLNWVQQQADRWHRQLRITAAQEQAWTQFAEIMRANARHLEQLYQDRSEHYENMSAVDNLKNYQEIIQAQAEDLSKKGAAFQVLYDALSPEQKQSADRIFRYQEERREQRHLTRRG
jgi:hypothetical protein